MIRRIVDSVSLSDIVDDQLEDVSGFSQSSPSSRKEFNLVNKSSAFSNSTLVNHSLPTVEEKWTDQTDLSVPFRRNSLEFISSPAFSEKDSDSPSDNETFNITNSTTYSPPKLIPPEVESSSPKPSNIDDPLTLSTEPHPTLPDEVPQSQQNPPSSSSIPQVARSKKSKKNIKKKSSTNADTLKANQQQVESEQTDELIFDGKGSMGSQSDPMLISLECQLLPFVRDVNQIELRFPADRLPKAYRRLLKFVSFLHIFFFSNRLACFRWQAK